MPCPLHAVLYTNCADWYKKCGRYRNFEGLPEGSVYMTDFCYPGLSHGSHLFFKNDGFILPLIFGRGLCLLARLFHCDFIRITQNWLWVVPTARWQSESAILAKRFGTRYAQWWSNICLGVLMWPIFNFQFPPSSRGEIPTSLDAHSLSLAAGETKRG